MTMPLSALCRCRRACMKLIMDLSNSCCVVLTAGPQLAWMQRGCGWADPPQCLDAAGLSGDSFLPFPGSGSWVLSFKKESSCHDPIKGVSCGPAPCFRAGAEVDGPGEQADSGGRRGGANGMTGKGRKMAAIDRAGDPRSAPPLAALHATSHRYMASHSVRLCKGMYHARTMKGLKTLHKYICVAPNVLRLLLRPQGTCGSRPAGRRCCPGLGQARGPFLMASPRWMQSPYARDTRCSAASTSSTMSCSILQPPPSAARQAPYHLSSLTLP